MPTSEVGIVPVVVKEMRRLQPRSILDVGIGFGKWGFLAREYLDVWQGRLGRGEWEIRIDGIEAFPGYHNPLWDWIYDSVHIGDVRNLAEEMGSYDLVLMCDVIEHLDRPSGVRVVQALMDRSRAMIVTTPTTFWAQGAENGNPFERHVSHWKDTDFRKFGGRTIEYPGQLVAILSTSLSRSTNAQGHWLDSVGARILARALGRRIRARVSASFRSRCHGLQ